MKNGKSFFGAGLAILCGASLILGNHLLASNVLAVGGQAEPAIVIPEGEPVYETQSADIVMYGDASGEAYMTIKDGTLALNNVSSDLEITDLTLEESGPDIQIERKQMTLTAELPSRYENPTDGNLSEEEAKKIGIDAITKAYVLTQKDIDESDVKVRGEYTSVWPSAAVDKLIWTVQLEVANTEDNPAYSHYRAIFDDKLEEDVNVHAIPLIKEGTPSANEISSDKAGEIGIAELTKKYALKQETLDRFTVTVKYYEVTPDAPGKHTWWVNLYPTNVDEFSEIGCYWTYIDAETGEALKLLSAVDGKG